jgi:KRAB domain-containing zinc finger protein
MEEKLYNCGTCGKSYKREGCLKKHECNTFTCNTCSKRFNSNANLEIHIRVHTGEKPFCCASCGTLYATMYQLVKHEMTGEKTFLCDACVLCHNSTMSILYASFYVSMS